MVQRILRDTPATLSATFYPAGSENGTNDGTVTVAVTRADGTVVAGVGAVSAGTAGAYTAALPAQTDLDLLSAVWSGATSKVRTYHEIVGGYIVELADIRAQSNITGQAKFTTTLLEDARAWFTDLFTDYCGFSPVPRFAHELINGSGTNRLVLTTNKAYIRTVRYAAIGGTAISTDDLAKWDVDEGVIDGRLAGTVFTAGEHNIEIGYEHGLDTPPADLRRAALTAIRARLLGDLNSQMPDRAISMSNEFGNIQYAQPSQRFPTGYPDVDAVLRRLRLPVMA